MPVVAADITLQCGDAAVEVSVQAGTATTLALAVTAPTVLEVDEWGRDLAWRQNEDATFSPIALRPPRWGKAMIRVSPAARVDLQLTDSNALPGLARVQLHCADEPEVIALADCLHARGHGWPGWFAFRRIWQKPEATCSGFHFHEAAARASERADYGAAIALYTRAAEAWRQLGETPREAAAQLGLAERLADAGRYEEALEAASQAAANARKSGARYYALRAESTRCLFLDDMGRLAEATACLRPVPDAFAELGEVIEAANTWNNLAAFDLDRGDVAGARRDVDRARAYAAHLPPRISARVHLSVSRVAAAEGRFPEALAALQAAFDAVAQADDERGRANVLLQAARQYQRLSAPLEARVMAGQALELYRKLGAPERIAATTALLARLDFDEADLPAAVAAAGAAARLYEQSGLRVEELGARILAARAGDAQAWQDIDRLMADPDHASAWLAMQVEVARIEQSIGSVDRDRADELAARLDALAGQVHDIQQWLDIHRLQGRALLRAGKPEAAVAGLEAALARHRTLVHAARLPSLRQMLLRQSRPLAAVWVDALLALPVHARPEAAAIREHLRELYGTHLLQPRGDDVRKADAALDRELAALLRANDGADMKPRQRAHHSLLLLFAASGGSQRPGQAMPRLSPAAPVPDGVVRLTYGFGELGALVIVERDGQAVLLELPAATGVVDRVNQVLALVQHRDSRAGELHRHAAGLARILLPVQLGPAPSQLWIDWDPVLAAMPFALMPWPGNDWPMVEDTAISRRLGNEAAALRTPDGIDLLVAARPAGAQSSDLPVLIAAEQEPGLVAEAFPRSPVRVHSGRDGGRLRLESVLGQPGAWLHVAAHGVSRSGIQGLAGLWLESEVDGGAPQFVSWLGLTDTPLAADLVVLNACQLADSDAAVTAAIGFATALAAAGVDHVVAANWQLSDSASSVWVPAFYRDLASGSGSPALALREAQRALRRSRAFRHPFYWAGLGHLQGLR